MVAIRCIHINIFSQTVFLLSLLSGIQTVNSQSATYSYFYRVYFKDKGSYTVNDFSPQELLSERAIDRRNKSAIPVPDYRDLPVFKDYLNQVKSKGFVLHTTSKWMNTGLFKTKNLSDVSQILSLPFVATVKVVKRPVKKGLIINKSEPDGEYSNSLPFDNPLTMVNGYPLHNSGYTGKGIIIAVLDGGFWQANTVSSLEQLRARGGVKGTRDFVAGGTAVYGYHNHGTAVLSILAGSLPGQIAGTAPGADYWLLRTEDTSSEFPVEEDLWAAGAEFADSLGADIISSSLGYYEFDDPALNYKFSDMNGNTAFVTIAADIAASKGILVVASAGNERNKTWKRIIAPSDGDSVLSAGAVDGYNEIAVFSSAGPAADGRIKPDNVAQGVAVPLQTLETVVSLGSGTSFSCPVISGICACVMQAVPEAINYDIIEALHNKGDKFVIPDSLYGYGVPDMLEALRMLQEKYIPETGYPSLVIPNPVTGLFEIVYQEPPGTLEIEIFSASGKLIMKKNYGNYVSRSITISEIQDREAGIYIIRSKTTAKTFSNKFIKVER